MSGKSEIKYKEPKEEPPNPVVTIHEIIGLIIVITGILFTARINLERGLVITVIGVGLFGAAWLRSH